MKNLEENASELEEKYRKQVRLLGIIDRNGHGKQHQGERFMDHEQVDLLNKILKLESELQAKDKENKLLQMKIKESGYATMQNNDTRNHAVGRSISSNSRFLRYSSSIRNNQPIDQ